MLLFEVAWTFDPRRSPADRRLPAYLCPPGSPCFDLADDPDELPWLPVDDTIPDDHGELP